MAVKKKVRKKAQKKQLNFVLVYHFEPNVDQQIKALSALLGWISEDVAA